MTKSFLQRFFKGWNSDLEPSQQPQDSVRESVNMRIMAENNNSAADQSMKGTFESLELNPNYFPIGWCRIANQIVILSTKDITGTDGNGEIGIATIDQTTLIGTYTPLYNHQDLNFNARYQIECRAYDENESKRRVYWTDDYNPLRALNLLDTTLNTPISAGSLVLGNEYMCVKGTVTNGTSTYGPNEASGTVFTADTTEVYSAGARVVGYVNVNTIDVVPSRDQGYIQFSKWLLNGSLLGGSYQYCYQLMTNDGTVTNFSYVSQPFHVTDSTVPSASSLVYQAMQGSGITQNSQKGIQISIDNIDQNFDQIRVVAIHTLSDTATDVPKVIFEGDITDTQMTFDHYGTEALGDLTAEDLAAVVLAIKRVNTLDILKQKMFIGNIRLADFVSVDTSGYTMEPIEYRFPVDYTGRPDSTTDSSTAGLTSSIFCLETGIVTIATDQWYEVTATPVSYNGGPALSVGDTFQGVAGVHTFVGAGSVQAVIKIQKYTGEYRIIPIKDDFSDLKSAAVATHLKSLHRGETYRWGILIYDAFQNPQYVHWIKDWECPSVYATTDPNTGNPLSFNPRLGEEYLADYGANASLSARSIGVKFSNIDFNQIATDLGISLSDLPRYIGGWSIVRAKRDAQVIAQGVLMPSSKWGIDVRPIGPPEITDDYYYVSAGSTRGENCYFMYSPDLLFDTTKAVAQDGDYLEVVDFINDQVKGFTGGTLEANNYHYYEKHYVSAATPANTAPKGTQNNLVAANCNLIVPDANGISIGATGDVIKNESGTDGGVGTYGVNDRFSVGGYTFFCYTETAEPTGGWVSFASATSQRSLVNFVRPKTSLYGGNSEAAKAATEYIYCGHYQPMDANFMAYLVSNSGIVDDVEVFGGDTYVTLMDIARMIREDNGAVTDAVSFGSLFLVESSINVSLREGRHLTRDRSFDQTAPAINTNGISYSNPTRVEEFVYNEAYSYEESQIKFLAVPLNYLPNNHFKRRVYASPTKTDGELVDNFRIFPINDFIDLDGTNGDLINLKSKSGRLFYWQQDAFGYLPVFERESIPNQLGQPVTIGTGGVLERYDDIVNYYGNQHQWGIAETEDSFVWFDARKLVVVLASIGANVIELSLANGLRNQFAGLYGAFLTDDNPVRNSGIVAEYNPSVKEAMIVFRGFSTSEPGPGATYIPVGYAVGFDNVNRQFTGKFDLLPGMMLRFNNMLLMSYPAAFRTIAVSTSYSLGDRVTEGTSVYVCISAYTSGSPATAPSTDTAHWAKIMDINEIHIADRGDVCKFFGYVYDSSVTVVVNPDFYENKVFYNMKLQSSDDFFDAAVYSNSHQSGSDSDISNNTEYERIYTDWYWSVPFDTNGERFVDKYIQLKLTKDNKLNGMYNQSSNERVKIVSLITDYRKEY